MQFKTLLFASLLTPSLAAVITRDDVSVQDNVLVKKDVTKCYSGPSGYGHSNELMDCIQRMADNRKWQHGLPTRSASSENDCS